MSQGTTMIWRPLSRNIKPWQLNRELSYQSGHGFPEALLKYAGSGHPTDSGRRFNDAKDSDTSSWQNLTLNRLVGCNGCDGCYGSDGFDGRSDKFYTNTRIRRPNDWSTGQFWDEYGEQFGRSLVIFKWTPSEEFGWTSASSAFVWSVFVTSQLVASQADWHTA